MPTKNHTLSSRIDELEARDRVKRSEPGARSGVLGMAFEIGGGSPVLGP